MRTADDLYAELETASRKPRPDYGGVVFVASDIYSGLKSVDEHAAFFSALELLLESEDQRLRKWAVTVCLGFVNFRDVIEPPKFERS